jgi:hypothetical protein
LWSEFIMGTSIAPAMLLPNNPEILITSYYDSLPNFSQSSFIVIALNVSTELNSSRILWKYISSNESIALPVFSNKGGAIGNNGTVYQIFTSVVNETNQRELLAIDGFTGNVFSYFSHIFIGKLVYGYVIEEQTEVDASIVGVLTDGTLLLWDGVVTLFINTSQQIGHTCNGRVQSIVESNYLVGITGNCYQ